MPLSLFPSQLGIIHRSHRHESRAHSLHVLLLITSITLHIRLSETEINLEVGIGTVGHSYPLSEISSGVLKFFSLGEVFLVIFRCECLGSGDCFLKSLAGSNSLLASRFCTSFESSLGMLDSLQEVALLRCAHRLEAHASLPR